MFEKRSADEADLIECACLYASTYKCYKQLIGFEKS